MTTNEEHCIVNDSVDCLAHNVDTQASIVIHQSEEVDGNTSTSDLASAASSSIHKSSEFILIAEMVRKCLFKFCKFVTNSDSVEYGQPFSLFCLEELKIVIDQQNWWKAHRKGIVQTLNKKRGCVVESLKTVFKSNCNLITGAIYQ